MFRCRQNTNEIKNNILRAAKHYFEYDPQYQIEDELIQAVFEGGQWYVIFFDGIDDETKIFLVSDAEGVDTYDGFAFKNVD